MDCAEHGELLNALVLSRLLNRTLLLPPARLGSALAWSSDLEERMSESESCKTNATAVSASDCDSWTNVNFNFLLDPQLLQEFNLVDRWNASSDWLQLEYDLGGMGISPEEMRVFEDRSRRSYRFYDDSYDADGLSRFDSRINLDDLINDEAKLLKFGSLFGPQRIKLTKRENLNLFHRVRKGLIFRNERLNAISEGARVLMGHGYVGVHLRTRDGVFRVRRSPLRYIFLHVSHSDVIAPQSQLTRNLQHVFTSIICDVFKLSPIIAQSLLDRSTTMPSFQTSSIFPSLSVDSSLRCSRPLYTNKEYFSLNRPIYIATDARHPRRNPALSSFFNTFPCVFILDDFLRRTPYNTRPLKTLVEMRDDKEEYKSRWDGLGLARFLYPFLEAEIVAKGSSVVGSTLSTRTNDLMRCSRLSIFILTATGSSFSRYAKFILSPFYKSDSASAALSVGPTLQSSERVTDVS